MENPTPSSSFVVSRAGRGYPRLPLDGSLDLTYRCNNNCRHCWLWLPEGSPRAQAELSFAEIRRIVAEARQLGCQSWGISGGEPMLRPDFPEIFDYITRHSRHYRLNTNGTLITPQIARLMTRRGNKMVAIYGATAEVNDHVTRSPGSFAATMRGVAYLKEAGAGFTVQVIPMRANYHQYPQMLELAQSLSPHYRVGAEWLYLSACGSAARNRQIASQRLDPADVITLNPPSPSVDLFNELRTSQAEPPGGLCGAPGAEDHLFAACIAARRGFHIDPYGGMTFCCFVKDPDLRYDLRQGSFREAWVEFIPSLADVVRGGEEYLENCASCELREDCRWCPVYAYLEHGRYSARVDYLCQIAEQTHQLKKDWKLEHLRYYQIAGLTIQVIADFPISDETFAPKFRKFQVDEPGEDLLSIRLVSSVPPLSELKLGRQVYRQPPWAIYQQRDSWVYAGISPDGEHGDQNSISIFSKDHSQGTICRRFDMDTISNLGSLTTYASDQFLLARVLADRQAAILHASGMIVNGVGLLFVGHSEAGKSTMLKLLRGQGEILCDDRIILRRWTDGIRIHGTWSHGELPDVSPAGAPLGAILYLEKEDHNELIPLRDKKERLGKVLSYVVKPLVTADWWEKTLDLAGNIAAEVPAYRLRFDKTGGVVDLIQKLVAR